MTVGTLVQPTQYAGNGVATTFSFPGLITATTDLVVGFIVGGVYSQQFSGYSIPAAGIGNSGGCQVVFTVAPPGGTTVDLRTLIPETQPTDFSNLGPYLPENNTASVDRCVRQIQDLYRLTYQFGIHGPDSESVSWPALPGPSGRAGTQLGFDPVTGLPSLITSPATAFSQSIFNGYLTNAPTGGAATPTEIANLITPLTQYPVGSYRRYGADPAGLLPSQTAILNACKCNAVVFDDYPGGGTYLINAEIQPPNFPLTITGQARNNKDVNVSNGTVFLLGSAAGSGAAALAFSYVDNLRIQNIGFQFQSGSLSQYGIHIKTIGGNAGQMRSSIVEGCALVGTGVGDTNVGIKVDSGTAGGQYSAFNSIRDNYFTGLSCGIWMTGNCTPNTILSNGFLGYTGAGSTVAGNAIQLDYPVLEIKIISNYFEGWINGVSSNGAQQIQQIANDYQTCTHSFDWVQTTYTVINNQSFGETGVGGVYSGQTNLDASQINLAGRLGWLATGGAIGSTRGFQEGTGSGSNLRTQLLGYGASPSVVMAANGGGTISAQTTTVWSVSYVGGHLYLDFNVSATLTGSGTSALELPLPGGVTPIVGSQNPCSVTNNSATAFGVAYVNTSNALLFIGLAATGTGNFTAGPVQVVGQIKIRIVS